MLASASRDVVTATVPGSSGSLQQCPDSCLCLFAAWCVCLQAVAAAEQHARRSSEYAGQCQESAAGGSMRCGAAEEVAVAAAAAEEGAESSACAALLLAGVMAGWSWCVAVWALECRWFVWCSDSSWGGLGRCREHVWVIDTSARVTQLLFCFVEQG